MKILLEVLILVATGLCFAGLCWVALRALENGATTYGGAYSARTALGFEDLFLFIPPRRIAEIAWICAAVVFTISFLVTGGVSGSISAVLARLAISLVFAGLTLFAPPRVLAILRVRRRERFNKQLVDALSDMGNALKSGFSIAQAIEHVVENGERPLSEEFATLLQQTRVGVPFDEALHNLDRRVGSEDLSLVILSIETARRTGGNLAEIFGTISKTIRERLRIQERIKTLTSQGRLQGLILSLMPLVIGVALNFVNPGMIRPFMHSAAGIGTVVAVAVLLLLGGLSIRKIVNIDM